MGNDYEFDLDLPDVLRSLAFYATDEDGVRQLRFDPAVYLARYSAVNSILTKDQWIPHIKKVTEFGCADMSLTQSMRRNEHLEQILQTKSKTSDLLTTLFGDLSDDDDCIDDEAIFQILDSVKVPKMLSPIKDWPDDFRIVSPPSLQLDIAEPTIDNIEPAETSLVNTEISSDPFIEATKMLMDVPSPEIPIDTEAFQVEQPKNAAGSTDESSNTTEAEDNSDKDQLSVCEEVNIQEIDYYSPASPKPEDQVSTEQPATIPTNTMSGHVELKQKEDTNEPMETTTNSALDQIIYNYAPSTRNEVMSSIRPFNEAECYLIASLRNAIEKYCLAKEWTKATITYATNKLFVLSRQPKHLATAILEVVEDTEENLLFELKSSAPALQLSHQKCLVLVSHLEQHMPSFGKYVLFELERKMFTFHHKEKSTMAMTNLAHFFIALVDIEQPCDRSKVRLFMYKCLYYFKQTAVPLLFTVIMAHPNALPHANQMEFISDPLVRAIVSTVSNIVYTEGTKHKYLLKSEMFHTLKRRYGFFMDKLFPTDSIVDYCIECIQANRLRHVDYALILIAKRQENDYVMQKILEKHLIPMLHQYFSMNLNVNTEHDEKICTILFTIGSIVKAFPIEENISGFLHIFVTCLNATQRQIIQEAAISALCQMSRFGTTQIYPHLASWKPNYTISSHIQAMLKTIVYRKPKQFWFDNEKR